MAKGNSQKMRNKAIIITLALLIIGFGAAVISLFRLQIIEGETLKTRTINQSLRSTELTAMRGTIYDSSEEKVLAKSASVWTVVLEPALIEEGDEELIAEGLSRILDVDKETILKKAADRTSYFTYIKRKVETTVRDEIVEYLNENKISSGVRLVDDYKRYYPYGDVASAVLGFTGTDNNGLSGLELQYDDELSGTAGRMVNAQDGVGKDMPFQYEQLVGAENGYNLILTIDETVQSIVEKHIDKGIEQYEIANGAVGIVMNVNTGAIVALVSKGGYDLNDPFTIYDPDVQAEIDALPEDEQDQAYNDALNKQWRNKAVSDTYYPGSVFKMCVGAMGIEEGVVSVNTPFYCSGVSMIEGTGGIHCWYRSGHGSETFVDGLCNSCNPYFIFVGQQLGATSFFKYFDAFGFTEKTGIDLPAESRSLYHAETDLKPAELATSSMGQNFAITPIQMITGVATVANGGYLVQPHVVSKITDDEGNIIKSTDTSYKRQVISEDTSETMADILRQNVEDGTATAGYVAGYRISGKTGTSEKIQKHNEDKSKPMEYVASYCGFAPSDNPEYVLLVFFDEPQGALTGGNSVAGPIFADIMKEILPYLGVKAEYTEEELADMDTTAPDLIGMTVSEANDELSSLGLSYSVVGDEGDDQVVTQQVPTFGQLVPNGGKVVLYTSNYEDDDMVTVPDFKGYSYSGAKDLASEYGVQICTDSGSVVDTGHISYQETEAGTSVKKGTVIKVSFTDDIITDNFTE